MLKTYYFVCLSFFLVLTDDARGESDYSLNVEGGGWLKLYSAPEAWEEALLKCQQDGAVLASPLNKGLAHALQLQMTQFGVTGNIFLGTHALFSKGLFASIEGVPLYDLDIKLGAQGTGDCLTMSVDGTAHFSSCTDPLPFVCYRKSENQTNDNECGTIDKEYQLNKQTGSCYKVHQTLKSWSDAYSTCLSEGAYLVILNDAEEARIVRNLLPSNEFPIGLVTWGKDRAWLTIHGESIDNVYNEWDAGEPDAYSIKVRGVCRPSGKLYDHYNDTCSYKFICEKSPPR